MFIGYYNVSIILTFIGLLFTVLGINYALTDNILIALIFLLLSGICDTFDGTVAKLCKRSKHEKLYGIELDSLVDTISFGIFPIIIGFSLGYNSIINIIIYFIYIFCGITRLAYFNIDLSNKLYFKGLPITTSSFILPVAIFFSTNEIFIMIIYLLMSFLFIFNFKIPKSSIKLKILYLITFIIVICLLILKLIGVI